MKLAKAFAFIDAERRWWRVPKGAIVDGASIPKALWSLIGGPFEGKYRNASIVHDWYCDVRTRLWEDVHRMFHEALLTSGVGRLQAQLMYAAVRRFGPRWSPATVDNNRLAARGGVARARSSTQAYTLRFNKADYEQLVGAVSSKRLTLDEVDELVDAQTLNRYRKSALRGGTAALRRPYS